MRTGPSPPRLGVPLRTWLTSWGPRVLRSPEGVWVLTLSLPSAFRVILGNHETSPSLFPQVSPLMEDGARYSLGALGYEWLHPLFQPLLGWVGSEGHQSLTACPLDSLPPKLKGFVREFSKLRPRRGTHSGATAALAPGASQVAAPRGPGLPVLWP